MNPPCVIFEDDSLLVVNKPAGLNTHSPTPHGGEGIYEWLRHREPRWAALATIHRLDKQTSGLLVFTKTPGANRSLTEQFAAHAVAKRYLLLSARPVGKPELTVRTCLVRVGDKYVNRPEYPQGNLAETRFRPVSALGDGSFLIEATPLTGRTHQIRAHAAEAGFPILGDTLYGGLVAPRICLHSSFLSFAHPETAQTVAFEAPHDFGADPRPELRRLLIEPGETDSFRVVHGEADGQPGLFAEKLGPLMLAQTPGPLDSEQEALLRRLAAHYGAEGFYRKTLSRKVGSQRTEETCPALLFGRDAPASFAIRENGVVFEASFREGYSYGLFLDQRDNRRRLLVNYVAPGFIPFPDGGAGAEVLNTFAYTCGFSVCAAKAGARVTSLDLSKKYLDWGRRNFLLNGLDPGAHDFIYGDAENWMGRLAKKGRLFDLILLDPPTFSRSKEGAVFQAEKDYGRLVESALPILKDGGVLFASTNSARIEPEAFLGQVRAAATAMGRKIGREQYIPQPPDYPVSREEPAHLKTAWFRLGRA